MASFHKFITSSCILPDTNSLLKLNPLEPETKQQFIHLISHTNVENVKEKPAIYKGEHNEI